MLKKWPIKDCPPTLSASQFLCVAIFQLEHETHSEESVLQWSHSAMEMLKKHTLIFYPSSFQNVNYEFCELYLGGERKQGLQGWVTKAGAGIDWVNSVHTSAATSYTTLFRV